MTLTQYWECDGCGYRTTEPPGIGRFYRYSSKVDVHGAELIPMMSVTYENPSGESTPDVHVCEKCFSFGLDVQHKKDSVE